MISKKEIQHLLNDLESDRVERTMKQRMEQRMKQKM